MEISLNGSWEFCSAGGEKLPAEVPGCNYTDLLSLNKIEDPFYGTNDKEASKIGEKDFIYFKKFDFSEDIDAFDKITLYAERLDTICTLKLNGKEIGKADNCHIPHEFDVSSALKRGENQLEIYFVSPVNYVKLRHKESPAPHNNNGMDGIVHIRKPQCHFGWDWGPVLPPSGVCGNICLRFKKRGS